MEEVKYIQAYRDLYGKWVLPKRRDPSEPLEATTRPWKASKRAKKTEHSDLDGDNWLSAVENEPENCHRNDGEEERKSSVARLDIRKSMIRPTFSDLHSTTRGLEYAQTLRPLPARLQRMLDEWSQTESSCPSCCQSLKRNRLDKTQIGRDAHWLLLRKGESYRLAVEYCPWKYRISGDSRPETLQVIVARVLGNTYFSEPFIVEFSRSRHSEICYNIWRYGETTAHDVIGSVRKRFNPKQVRPNEFETSSDTELVDDIEASDEVESSSSPPSRSRSALPSNRLLPIRPLPKSLSPTTPATEGRGAIADTDLSEHVEQHTILLFIKENSVKATKRMTACDSVQSLFGYANVAGLFDASKPFGYCLSLEIVESGKICKMMRGEERHFEAFRTTLLQANIWTWSKCGLLQGECRVYVELVS